MAADDAVLTLYPHQERAARWLISRRSGLLAMAPGLGKTATSIRALRDGALLPATVVCPLTLLPTWRRELREWWPDAVVQGDGRAKTGRQADVSLTTYERLRRDGLPRGTGTLVVDESVLCKNRKALRTRCVAQARKQVRTCWMLSGSPTTRFLDDLWAQLHALEPRGFPSYWQFVQAYCLTTRTVWSMVPQIVANVPGVEDRLRQDLAEILYSYSYTDLARDEPSHAIPDWDMERREVALPAAWWMPYQQMQQHFLAHLPDGDLLMAPNSLAKLTRCLQLASHPALPNAGTWTRGGKSAAARALVEELPQPCVLWTYYVATAMVLAETLGAPALTGLTSVAERAQIVTVFQNGRHPVLVAHPGVGRFGLTLTRARSAIYVERGYDGDAWYQSLHRIRRLGTTEPPRVVVLLATGPNGQRTVDHAVDRVLGYRFEKAQALTAGRVREVLGEEG